MSAWPLGTDRKALAQRAGILKRIHVNKHVIAANAKHGRNDPAITIQTSAGSFTARKIEWTGRSVMIHDAEHPLSCGAKVWIETTAAVHVVSL
jgi:hypothetical protein